MTTKGVPIPSVDRDPSVQPNEKNSLETVTNGYRLDGPRETAELEIPELRLIV